MLYYVKYNGDYLIFSEIAKDIISVRLSEDELNDLMQRRCWGEQKDSVTNLSDVKVARSVSELTPEDYITLDEVVELMRSAHPEEMVTESLLESGVIPGDVRQAIKRYNLAAVGKR